jgi:hypothetical protein
MQPCKTSKLRHDKTQVFTEEQTGRKSTYYMYLIADTIVVYFDCIDIQRMHERHHCSDISKSFPMHAASHCSRHSLNQLHFAAYQGTPSAPDTRHIAFLEEDRSVVPYEDEPRTAPRQ